MLILLVLLAIFKMSKYTHTFVMEAKITTIFYLHLNSVLCLAIAF